MDRVLNQLGVVGIALAGLASTTARAGAPTDCSGTVNTTEFGYLDSSDTYYGATAK